MKEYNKFATCTPVAFEGDARFFTRDTGLLCRGIQSIGENCIVVMPGEPQEADGEGLVRCSWTEIEDPAWWVARELDLVVLYAWGDPRFHAVALAIRSAGIRLIQSMDTAGLQTPYADLALWMRSTLAELSMPQSIIQRLKRLVKAGRDFVPSLYDRSRLRMMDECDMLAAVSPPAAESLKDFCVALDRDDVAAKVSVCPHPVSLKMMYEGESKERHLLVVGRWGEADKAQKDPELTLQVVGEFLKHSPQWTAEIIGWEAEALEVLVSDWAEGDRERISFCNFIVHDDLRKRYAGSRMLLCASRFESFHIASAEAVCSGCSVVVADQPLLASTAWFVTKNSGTLAKSRSCSDLAQALKDEAQAWDEGSRKPEVFSQEWIREVRCDHVGRKIRERVLTIKS